METSQELKEKIVTKHETDLSRVQLSEKTTEEQVDTFLVIPPDGGWGWMIVLAAFFSFLVADGIVYAYGTFLKDMSETFKCSTSQVALTGAIMSGFFCLVGPFVSALVNQFGYRAIAVTGSLVASISCILTSTSSSVYLTFLTHGVMGGMGFGLIYLPAVIAVGFYFERWRALATGIAACGAGIGGIALPPILAILIDQIGWRCTFRVTAGLSFVCAFCGLLYRPLKPVKLKRPDIPTNEKEQEQSKSFFVRFHNSSHPTVADIQTKSHPTIAKLHHPIATNNHTESHPVITDFHVNFHTSTAESETTSTMTIFKPQKLPRYISSEFLMSTVPSTFSSGSKGSFKSIDAEKPEISTFFAVNPDSKLSTVYEEPKEGNGCCQTLSDRWFCKNYSTKNEEVCFTCFPCKPCFRIREKNNSGNVTARPLYRDDIFYSASLMILPEYRKSLYTSQGKVPTTSTIASKSKSNLEYNMLVTRAITQKELEEAQTCTLCSEAVKRTLATMLDLSLLKSPSFILLTLHAVFTSMGFYTPYMFIKDRAIQYGVPEEMAFWLISCIGFTNTFSRIACGIVTSFSENCALEISYTSLFIGGLATSFSGLSYNIWVQFGYAAVFGISVGCMATLRTIIMVEMLGLEKLTNAIGVMLMFQGVASLSGTSISGFLKDLTGDYEMSFYFAGGCMSIGSLLLIPIKKVSAWEKQRDKRNMSVNSKPSH